jgi:hypothetical protein
MKENNIIHLLINRAIEFTSYLPAGAFYVIIVFLVINYKGQHSYCMFSIYRWNNLNSPHSNNQQ